MKSIMGPIAALAAAGALTGCSPVSHAPGEMHLTLPSWDVPAGAEKLMCVYATMPTSADVYAWKFVTAQAPGGHHLAVFTTTENQPDGTVVDCSNADVMTSWRPLLTGLDKDGFEFPDGYAVRVPAGAKLVVQSHYVNASTQTIHTADEIGVFFKESSEGLTLVGTSANTTVDFAIPAGSTKSVQFDCNVTQEMKVFTFFGHMHEWGSHITIDAGGASAPPQIYDMAWQPSFRDHPPAISPGFASPLVLEPGDVIRTTCTWDNTQGSTALGFPEEMCVSLFWFYPADQSLVCAQSTASN